MANKQSTPDSRVFSLFLSFLPTIRTVFEDARAVPPCPLLYLNRIPRGHVTNRHRRLRRKSLHVAPRPPLWLRLRHDNWTRRQWRRRLRSRDSQTERRADWRVGLAHSKVAVHKGGNERDGRVAKGSWRAVKGVAADAVLEGAGGRGGGVLGGGAAKVGDVGGGHRARVFLKKGEKKKIVTCMHIMNHIHNTGINM